MTCNVCTYVVMWQFGDETDGAVRQRQQARDQVVRTHQLVEEERRKAEEKLKRRMEKMKVQKMQNGGGSLHTDSASGSVCGCTQVRVYHVVWPLCQMHDFCVYSTN